MKENAKISLKIEDFIVVEDQGAIIGSGDYSTVIRAYHPIYKKSYAIKIVS
jgi:serine/threonine protein kinase